jgi:hypothetical protein
MKTLNVNITNKVAVYSQRGGEIVCGNDDYQIKFTFDAEWSGYSKKIARFSWNGQYKDVDFTGDTVTVPALFNTSVLMVGVYAGDLSTTTRARITCVPSVLCGTDPAGPGSGETYYNEAKGAAERAEAAAETAAAEAAQTVVNLAAEQLLGGIVQVPGDRETQVMSQKAVTDYCVASCSYNLYDESEAESGYIIATTGNVGAHANYITSAFIPVTAGQSITAMSKIRYVAFYDADKTFINCPIDTDTYDNCTITAEVNGYVRITFFVGDAAKMIVYGDTIDEYKPYEKQIAEGYSFSEQQKEYIRDNTIGTEIYNLFNPEACENGYLNQGNDNKAVVVAYDSYITTDYIPVKEGQTITISPRCRKVYFLDAMQLIASKDDTEHREVHTATAPAVGYVRVTLFKEDSAQIIVYGDTIKEYVPHEKKITEGVSLSMEQKEWTRKTDILYCKKYVACGDSFTVAGYTGNEGIDESVYKYQDGIYKGKQIVYPYIIGLRNNMKVINLAQGGMTMCNIDGTRSNAFSNGVYLNVPTDADYITLKFGINDLNFNSPVGTIDDEDTTTFYGAWNVVLRHLLTNCPFAKIGIIVTNGCSSVTKYTDATLAIAKKWGIAYIDEVNDPTVPLLHRVHREGLSEEVKRLRLEMFRVSEDNTHPNVKAHYYEASFIEAWLKTL